LPESSEKAGGLGEAIGGAGNARRTTPAHIARMPNAHENQVSYDARKKPVELSPVERQRIARINAEVRRAGAELRRRLPWLRHQDALGVIALSLAVTGMVASGWLYFAGALPAWACVIASALFASIAHEVEHDLIHSLYFPRQAGIRGLMLAIAWLTRPGTLNPFVRKKLHLHHHKASGNADDLEERAITNGEPYGVKRLVMMLDGVLAVLLRVDQSPRGKRLKLPVFAAVGYFPLGWVHYVLFYAFLLAHGLELAGVALPVSPTLLAGVNGACVVWILPNVLRSFCLNFVSSSMHYYGDVERGNVLQQTQVLNAWFFAPLQLFCFNFGSTHAIHHFVASEPFYVRQLTASAAHRVLRENGVRFNDLGTFRRNNRYAQENESSYSTAEALTSH
jgi:fatty acid desaturase